jgi:hypothetical protein
MKEKKHEYKENEGKGGGLKKVGNVESIFYLLRV